MKSASRRVRFYKLYAEQVLYWFEMAAKSWRNANQFVSLPILDLPDDAQVLSVHGASPGEHDGFAVLVQSETFPEVPRGEMIPYANFAESRQESFELVRRVSHFTDQYGNYTLDANGRRCYEGKGIDTDRRVFLGGPPADPQCWNVAHIHDRLNETSSQHILQPLVDDVAAKFGLAAGEVKIVDEPDAMLRFFKS